MKTALTLVDPTDLDLDMAFAAHIAGFEAKIPRSADSRYWVRPKGLGIWSTGRAYTTSVDSVLPYLEAWRETDRDLRGFTINRDGHDYMIDMYGHSLSPTIHQGDSLARTIVIALLRANGVEITFS